MPLSFCDKQRSSAHGCAGRPTPIVEDDAIGRGLLCSPFVLNLCFFVCVIARFCLSLFAAKGTEVCKAAANRWTGR